jgi:hypothetical protein
MVPDASKTSLGLEYFCSEGDALWRMPDAELIALGTREVSQIGLADQSDVEDGCVVRVPKAYPVYDSAYKQHLTVLRNYVDRFENVQTIGRNGLHRYNNQDHAMLTGMLAVRNVAFDERHDLWSVNTDQEYHEEVREPRAADRDLAPPVTVLQDAVSRVFPKLDRLAFALSLGTVTGLVLCLATLWLTLAGGPVVGPRLGLLRNYFPGYHVTAAGSLVGLGYGFWSGFVLGWMFAFLRNAAIFLYAAFAYRRAELQILRRLFEYV